MLFEIYNVLNYAKKVLTAMVNNSTNINNTNDHFSAHITEHKKGPLHMALEIQDLACIVF